MTPRKETNLEKPMASQTKLQVKNQTRLRKPPNKDQRHFRFLDLSAELRNNIYDKIIEESALVLRRSNVNRDLASTSALVRVSKNIRSEFLPLALQTTPVIKTVVRDWDFGHVVRFLNSLEVHQLERLILEQRMVIDLCFSGENADPSGLMRWIDRFDDDRRGDGVAFEYVCTDLEFSRQNWTVAGFRACTTGGLKGSMQFDKIAEVFRSEESVVR
jgi:hypothetical protein